MKTLLSLAACAALFVPSFAQSAQFPVVLRGTSYSQESTATGTKLVKTAFNNTLIIVEVVKGVNGQDSTVAPADYAIVYDDTDNTIKVIGKPNKPSVASFSVTLITLSDGPVLEDTSAKKDEQAIKIDGILIGGMQRTGIGVMNLSSTFKVNGNNQDNTFLGGNGDFTFYSTDDTADPRILRGKVTVQKKLP